MPLPTFTTIRAALRDPKRWRGWLTEAALIFAIIIGISLWQNRGLPEGAAPPLAGMRTDGSFVKVGAGGTASLLVFWATWCPICKAEAGNIEAIATDWPVISVAMQSGDAVAVTQYLAARAGSLPAIVDASGGISADWRVRGAPTHFVIDPAGNIRFRVVGYATEIGLRARLWWANRFPLT
jgi:thiol-disulfide isomerase/thioredoxin